MSGQTKEGLGAAIAQAIAHITFVNPRTEGITNGGFLFIGWDEDASKMSDGLSFGAISHIHFYGGDMGGINVDTEYFIRQHAEIDCDRFNFYGLSIANEDIFNTAKILNITQANPAVVTVDRIGNLADGDKISISGVSGMVEINTSDKTTQAQHYSVGTVSGNTFQLRNEADSADINTTTGYTAYTSSGYVLQKDSWLCDLNGPSIFTPGRGDAYITYWNGKNTGRMAGLGGGDIYFDAGFRNQGITRNDRQTFADSDATPSVAFGTNFNTGTATTTVTMFDNGTTDQLIYVTSKAAITYDTTGTNLQGSSVDIVTASGDITMWLFDGTNWTLLSWIDISKDNSVTT